MILIHQQTLQGVSDICESLQHSHNYQQSKICISYFGKGNRYFKDPNQPGDREEYDPPDSGYDFSQCFNSGKPFRGGVGYGDKRGCPGYYPNLNNKDVRKWWGEQYDYLFRTGLEFVWQDMTSPCMARGFGDMLSYVIIFRNS